ncbi:4Fe-4S binding protein [Hydrogenispora ethanolica]|uniref:4Fe-4S binding protein n=1 Tax=Hydrogenispora ethanolica TaxID=1082276 RepID=A0A4V2QCM8_HYDET|nr:4Fe-4S binding protein [Hydrogenispora ethanolica]TCL60897.1 4Fe-4S binding protein [Hydrogenispora ethanolica]
MTMRKIIQIDEEKCNGCGLCVPSCAEGALQIIDGKARLVKDQYCDGLGACLGECPQGALQIIERDADEFNEDAVHQHLSKRSAGREPVKHAGCPGSRMMVLREEPVSQPEQGLSSGPRPELRQWPVQLELVPVTAPYFKDADLLIAADCVPFAYPDFHRRFLKGRSLIIGCPKLDDSQGYLEKLTEIFRKNDLNSVTVAHMEVPCCFGLVRLVKEALQRSGAQVPFYEATITINGEIQQA